VVVLIYIIVSKSGFNFSLSLKKIPMNIYRFCLSILFAVFFNNLSAQTIFQNTYGSVNGNQANTVILTNDGGYAVAGWYDAEGLFSAEFYLLVLDAAGDTLWTRTYGAKVDTSANGFVLNGSGNEGYNLIQTSDNGFLFVGERHEISGGTSDAYAVKIDEQGVLEWSRLYGGDDNEYGYAAAQTAEDEFVIGGFIETSGAGLRDMLLFKTNTFGDTLWTQIYGGPSIDAAQDMQATSDGGFILAGYTFSYGAGDSDVYIVKTDEQGDILWQKTYGGTLNDLANSIALTSDGGYIICGESESFGAGASDLYLLKIDSGGNLEWSKTFGGDGFDSGKSVVQNSDGGYIMTGYTRSFGNGGEDFYLIRTDAQGDQLWAKTFGGNEDETAQSVKQTLDDGFIITGYTRSYGAGALDVLLIKTDEMGNSECDKIAEGSLTESPTTIEGTTDAIINQGMPVKQRPTLTGFTNTIITDACDPVSTNENNKVTFSISPNPSSQFLTITMGNEHIVINKEIVIYDMLGQTISAQTLDKRTETIDISKLPSGVFFLSVSVEGGWQVAKFVKE
jgi:hypothetical protein